MRKAEDKFFRVNIALDTELSEKYGIDGTPTLLMFMDGKQVGLSEGPSPTVEGIVTTLDAAFEA